MSAYSQQESGLAGPPATTQEAFGLTQSEQAQSANALAQARQAIALAPPPPAPPSPNAVAALHSQEGLQEQAQAQRAASGLLSALQAAEQQKQSVDAMMALLIQETHAARRRKRARWAKNSLVALVIVWLLCVTHGRLLNWWWVFNFGGGWWAIDKASGRRGEAVRELRKAGDPRAVGALAVALRDGDQSIQHAASDALLNLLPRVRANHAAAITPDQMNALLELAFRSNFWMQIAVLKALEQIGDQRAIPVVQNLTLSSHKAVRDQANQCLPFLTERARRAKESATLLRGASSPGMTAGKGELLRPALQQADATPPEELLRPTRLDA